MMHSIYGTTSRDWSRDHPRHTVRHGVTIIFMILLVLMLLMHCWVVRESLTRRIDATSNTTDETSRSRSDRLVLVLVLVEMSLRMRGDRRSKSGDATWNIVHVRIVDDNAAARPTPAFRCCLTVTVTLSWMFRLGDVANSWHTSGPDHRARRGRRR